MTIEFTPKIRDRTVPSLADNARYTHIHIFPRYSACWLAIRRASCWRAGQVLGRTIIKLGVPKFVSMCLPRIKGYSLSLVLSVALVTQNLIIESSLVVRLASCEI